MQKPQFSKGDLVRPRSKNVILVVEEVFPNNKGPGYLVLCHPKAPRQPGEPYDDSGGIVHETTLSLVQRATDALEATGETVEDEPCVDVDKKDDDSLQKP